jgi:hypothetical protein
MSGFFSFNASKAAPYTRRQRWQSRMCSAAATRESIDCFLRKSSAICTRLTAPVLDPQEHRQSVRLPTIADSPCRQPSASLSAQCIDQSVQDSQNCLEFARTDRRPVQHSHRDRASGSKGRKARDQHERPSPRRRVRPRNSWIRATSRVMVSRPGRHRRS